jgi:hypothetical protein
MKHREHDVALTISAAGTIPSADNASARILQNNPESLQTGP